MKFHEWVEAQKSKGTTANPGSNSKPKRKCPCGGVVMTCRCKGTGFVEVDVVPPAPNPLDNPI